MDHIHSIADLLHADAVQQLEVTLLGSPVAHLINVLFAGLGSTTSTPQHQAVPLTQPIATTSASPPPPTVLVIGVTDAPERGAVETTATPSGSKATTPLSSKEMIPSKCQCIFPMPIPKPTMTQGPCSPSHTLPPFPIIVIPELAIPPYAQPEQLNCPGGCKDYQCKLCTFQHTNRDCMLMHICQHLEISISCPMCGKGFQNTASLRKHRKRVHAIQIVEMEDE